LREGTGKAQALQQAQHEVRAQYPHPYYWAAFVLTGDPGSYVAPASTSPLFDVDGSIPPLGRALLWVGICAVVLASLALGIVSWRRKRGTS
jgi:hypothetical protein